MPKLPPVKTGMPPARSRVKVLTLLLGALPPIRLLVARTPVGEKVLAPPNSSWEAREIITPLTAARGNGSTVSRAALLFTIANPFEA